MHLTQYLLRRWRETVGTAICSPRCVRRSAGSRKVCSRRAEAPAGAFSTPDASPRAPPGRSPCRSSTCRCRFGASSRSLDRARLCASVAAQRKTCCIDRLDQSHRIALDARNLHEARDRVAGLAQFPCPSDVRRVSICWLLPFSADTRPAAACRTGNPDFSLAAHLRADVFLLVRSRPRSTGNRRPPRRRFETPGNNAACGHDAGSAGDDLAAGRVLFDGERVGIDPIERMHRTRGVSRHQLAVVGRAVPHAEYPRRSPWASIRGARNPA